MRTRPPATRSRFGRRFAAAASIALLLAGCAGDGDAPDLVDRTLAATREVTGLFEPSAPRVPSAAAPPSEGRPYPNLASVPVRPPRPVAQLRDSEIAVLDRDRAAAERRRSDLQAGIVGEQARDPKGEFVGAVLIDSIGGVSAADEGILRRAVEMAGRRGDGRILLAGEARAALAAADRLTRLGFGRDRIELAPTPGGGGALNAVEITVARDAAGR